MKCLDFSRYALSSCAAAAMLAGCGGSQLPIGAPNAMPQGRASSGYTTLYSFGASYDGQQPKAGLIDLDGVLYGTTYGGGKGDGTVFSISTTGTEKVLYRFRGNKDGANPSASLIAVKGLLYGTTEYGGVPMALYDGTVFRVSTNGAEKVLHRFHGWYSQYRYDGANPVASLVYVKGKLYGTTSNGGSNQYYGTVFAISLSGKEKVLHSFFAYSDGSIPLASLANVNGTLYGTTELGGQNSSEGAGTVFSVTAAGTERVINRFVDEPYSSGGAAPLAALIEDNGTLYGTTGYNGANGGGTAFSVTTSGSLTLLHSFGSGSDGGHPSASLLNVSGTLYGTTSLGGAYGKGTVFSVTLSGNETVLHSFGFGSDGATPVAGLIDVNGTLYGTTSAGGTYGDGTVFALKP
ncbi:MAG: choice-of-anchor tandem repeat GloVer-containing protein [Candidatus Cybelea sp.]